MMRACVHCEVVYRGKEVEVEVQCWSDSDSDSDTTEGKQVLGMKDERVQMGTVLLLWWWVGLQKRMVS